MDQERVPRVALGEIATTHGLAGWLKLNPYNPQTTALTAGRRVFLESGGGFLEHEIEAVKPSHRQILIKLHGIDHIDQAKALVGRELSVDADSLEPLQEGEYYHYQVMGFEVIQQDGRRIGVIDGLISGSGHDLYSVRNGDKQYLIPVVKEIVLSVDLAARQIIIDPPDGLLDL